jgi:SAM-dependent methyltransferase
MLSAMEKKSAHDLIVDLARIRSYPFPEQLTPSDPGWAREFAVTQGHYFDLFAFLPDLKPEHRVLEIGLGYGYIAAWLRMKYQCQVAALEHPSRQTLTNPDFIREMDARKIEIVRADLLKKLPLASEAFDLVIFSEVLEHLSPTDVKKVMDELTRLVKRNGQMIITTPNVATLDNRWRGLRGVSIQPFPIELDADGDATFGHMRIYTLAELKKLCGLYKLKISKVVYSNNYKGKLFSDFRKRVLTSVFTGLHDDIYLLTQLT